jgi:hypothetical protein
MVLLSDYLASYKVLKNQIYDFPECDFDKIYSL